MINQQPTHAGAVMNTSAFLADHKRHFDGSYEQFKLFGGPCVYFHLECLRAGRERFLSDRHLEMLYATLTAWGLHRMGGTAKLTDWKTFRDSLSTQADTLRQFLGLSMLRMSESDYSDVVRRLRCCYESLDLSKANATVVVNSKAFHHLFPELIPPIDRQYTIRFFTQVPNKWRDEKRKFRQVPLPGRPPAI